MLVHYVIILHFQEVLKNEQGFPIDIIHKLNKI